MAGATAEERKAVQEQGELWAACSRLLKAVGERDARVESLLRDATKK
jgi:predicted RNA-binding protein with PIN domain